jgi:D-3-phosphoglycerate dehydrogenase
MPANRKRLLLSQSLPPAALALVEARADIEAIGFPHVIAPADLVALLAQRAPVHGIALGVTPFGEAAITAAASLAVVARIGVGFDAVDVAALTRHGIPLMVTGIANSPSVAEATLFMMLALAKRGAELDALVKSNAWARRLDTTPFDLYGKTVLIVGLGRIGTRVAARCRAMEMTVLAFDPYRSAAEIARAGCEAVADLDAALPCADVVTLHCPKTTETTDLFDAARLARMKPTAYLINTARGGIVNEAALHAALDSGQLAGAGIDVFASEPPPADHPLLRLPNVICAPHVAGVTREALQRMGIEAVRNILGVLDGAPNRAHVVNPRALVTQD